MADDFDPYRKWLGIVPKDQPPNYYRLLGIELFESDPDVIEGAADRQMAHLRTFQSGPHSADSQKLLNECAAARVTLLDPQKRAEYDRQLRQKMAASAVLPLSPDPQAGIPGRGEGTAPRPVPQTSALPLAKPLPQAKPLPAKESAPLIVSSAAGSASSVHQRPYRKTPIWRQPAILGTAGALVLFGAIAYFLARSGKLSTEVASSNPNTDITSNTTTDRSRTPPVGPATPPAPGADKPALPTSDRSKNASVSPPTTSARPAAEKSPLLVLGASGSPVDVLAAIDLDRDRLHGDWQYEGRALISPANDHGVLEVQLPAIVPADYQLDVVAQRESGDDCLSFTFPIAGTHASLIIDGRQGTESGLQMIDGKDFMSNESTRQAKIFTDGKPHSINITVRKNHVRFYCDGKALVDWAGDVTRLKASEEPPYRDRIYLGHWYSQYRLTKIKLRSLRADESPPAVASNTASPSSEMTAPRVAGPTLDLLKQIDLKRDHDNGDWQMVDGVLITPDQSFAKLLLPPPPAEEYRLEMVVERTKGRYGISLVLLVGGHQVMATIDGWDGSCTGLEAVDGKDCHDNPSTYRGRLLTDRKPSTVLYTVRRDLVQVTLDGRRVIDWKGDPASLSMIADWAVRDTGRLALCAHETVCRISKIEFTPLAPESGSTSGKPAMASSDKTRAGLLKVFEDELEFVEALSAGDGQAVLTTNESYSGTASVIVTGKQRYSEALPGLNVKIRKEPKAPDEYRYLRFAWKKHGGEEICLQLHYPSNWHRYCAGRASSFGPAIKVADQLPTDFMVVTRDLAGDFGEFNLTGLSLSAADGDWACFDHIYLARTLEDFEHIEVSPRTPPRRTFADLASDNGTGNKSRLAVPDEEAVKKARQEMLKKFASQIGAAKSPDQKRSLSQQLAQKAVVDGKDGAEAYVLLNQAIDLAEAAGDIDLAWQTIDQLAQSFAVESPALRNQSLAEIGKSAKSAEQAWGLADAACRLMVSALSAGDATAVKKAGTQAQSFAKRTKDRTVQKSITSRANDAGKLAGELDAVATARETLKKSSDDAKANLTIGHYELCAAGDWDKALPKLAKADDADWKKLATDELALDNRPQTGPRTFVNGRLIKRNDPADATRQLAAADGWWSRAENEPWPGRHYLHMRAAHWYAAAQQSLVDVNRTRANDRLRALLAVDEGLPAWELFRGRGFQSEQPTGDVLRIDRNRGVETAVEYQGPIDVTLVARTTGTEIRLMSHNWSWNWDFKVDPNRWHTLRYVITPFSRTAFADGVPVHNEASKTARNFNPAPVSIFVSDDSIIELKKFIVQSTE